MVTWSGLILPTLSGVNHCWEYTTDEYLGEIKLVLPTLVDDKDAKIWSRTSARRLFVGRKN